MKTDQPVLMQMLSTQMRYMSQRQGVLAQNIANADTPNYKAQDLKKLDFNAMANAEAGRLQMMATSPKHQSGPGANANGYGSEDDRATFEISPVKNNVNIEEQMAKVSETGAQYQIANSLYKKFTNLYKTSLGNN